MGDDIFIVEDLGNNRIRLIPAPTHVSEPGTPVNKALLQPMENHMGDVANPHATTKAQVGLGNVDNVKQAPKSEFDAHVNLTAAHSAISTATANRLIIRDSNGRASVADPTSASHIATKGYVDGFVRSLQAGTAFAYYLIPPNVEFSSNNTEYGNWWIRNEFRSAVACILLPGTIRYHVQYRMHSSSSDCHVRILLNGNQVREVGTSSTSWQTVTGNITVSPGDIVTIQKRLTGSVSSAYWRNVCIQTAQPTLGIQLT